jgi:hypothetical protein
MLAAWMRLQMRRRGRGEVRRLNRPPTETGYVPGRSWIVLTPFSAVGKTLVLALAVMALAVAGSGSVTAPAAGRSANLIPCGWIKAKGAPARVILMQGPLPLNVRGACTYARRLAVRCVGRGTAPAPWKCRRRPYPNPSILAVVERKNPLKMEFVDRGGPIGE